MHGEEIGAAVCISERDRDCHLAAHRGIWSLELVHFDDLLVGHEFYEMAVVRVGVRGCLTRPGRLGLRQ